MTHSVDLPGPPAVAKPGDRWFCPCCGTKHTAVLGPAAYPEATMYVEWVPDAEWGVRDDA